MDHLTKIIAAALYGHNSPADGSPSPFPSDEFDCCAAHVAAAIRADRTIATVEQLDALPVGTIIRDQDDEGLTRVGDGWACAGPFSPYPSSSVLEGGASATVLYRPDEDGE